MADVDEDDAVAALWLIGEADQGVWSLEMLRYRVASLRDVTES